MSSRRSSKSEETLTAPISKLELLPPSEQPPKAGKSGRTLQFFKESVAFPPRSFLFRSASSKTLFGTNPLWNDELYTLSVWFLLRFPPLSGFCVGPGAQKGGERARSLRKGRVRREVKQQGYLAVSKVEQRRERIARWDRSKKQREVSEGTPITRRLPFPSHLSRTP